nr:PAS domain S-box protein [Pollutimonas subterranea]
MQKDQKEQDGKANVLNTDALVNSGRFELLVHAIKDYAIYLLDLKGYIISWNTGAERFKGYTAQEIIGRHFSCLYTEEDQNAGVPARALAIAAEQGQYEVEGLRVRKDGSRFWASIVIDPVRDENGTLIGYAKVARDLTDKKAADQALFESEQRFRLLVQGGSATMQSICLIRTVTSSTGIPALCLLKAILPTKSSAATFPAFTRRKIANWASPNGVLRLRCSTIHSRTKVGASARTVRISGPVSLLTPFTTKPEN